MGKALYRKYRSRSLGEIVGQEHITTTLGNALKSGKFAHAYLLTGPRGTGKTSVARILAHEVNGLPYSEEPHFDIIEIDAASNNGVEDVRSLREKVQSAPTNAKYKVYIIDEVHMLSKPAFNALLKTLEEPPEHVIFILATTEVHKLPETIISRTQRFSFHPVEQSKVIDHLRTIAKKESIDIDEDALKLIAEHGEGSFRDSISLLDQASSLGEKVTLQHVEELLGRAPTTLIDGIIAALSAQDAAKVVSLLEEFSAQGFEAGTIASQLGKRLRDNFGTNNAALPPAETIDLLRELIDVSVSPRPAQALELTLLKRTVNTEPKAEPQPAAPKVEAPRPASPEEPPKREPQPEPAEQAIPPAPEQAEPQPEEPDKTPESTATQTVAEVEDLWHEVLQAIKADHNTLYGIARMAKPALDGSTLTLSTKFPFHQKRLNEVKNRTILANAVSKVRGAETSIVCVIAEKGDGAERARPQQNSDISTISNIFGGAELL
jgi:DNA polymerase-3 subunit gamma/tau